jgi:hypothetical protein
MLKMLEIQMLKNPVMMEEQDNNIIRFVENVNVLNDRIEKVAKVRYQYSIIDNPKKNNLNILRIKFFVQF